MPPKRPSRAFPPPGAPPGRQAGRSKPVRKAARRMTTRPIVPTPRTPRPRRVQPPRQRPLTAPRRLTGLGDLPYDPAPAAVSMSSDVSPIVILPSSHGRKRIRVRAAICQIGAPASSTVDTLAPGGLFIQSATTVGGTTAQAPQSTLLLNPLRMIALQTLPSASGFSVETSYWDSIRIALEGAGFSRFKMCSDLELEYEPNGSTAVTNAFVLTVTADPYNPNNGYMAYENAAYPSYNTVCSGDNFVTFASWARWKKSFPIDQKTEFYNYYRDEAATSTMIPADVRTAAFGALTCLANSAPVASIVFGRLIGSFDIEFFDPSPVLNGHLALPAILRCYEPVGLSRPRIGPARAGPGMRVSRAAAATGEPSGPIESKDGVARVTTDDDEYVSPSPPRYLPPPSAVPGGSMYVGVPSPALFPPAGYTPVPGIPGMAVRTPSAKKS
jgi:hypothetical protein